MESTASQRKQILLGLLMTLLLSLLVVVPTVTQGWEDRAHDSALHLYRSIVFSKVLQEGWWYPRWAPTLNLGLGSPPLPITHP